MRKTLLLIFLCVTFLGAKTYQLGITPNAWQMIGINGYHTNSASQFGFVGNGFYATIRDTNDSADVMTYDRNSSDSLNTVATPDTGDVTLSTLGVQILDGVLPALTGVKVNFRFKEKNTTAYLHTMYLTSSSTKAKPNIKIEFQSDYEGEEFYLDIGDGNTYKATFSSVYTFDNPQRLLINSTKEYVNISEIVDMNLSDNDIATLDGFDVGGAFHTPLSNYPDANLTMLKWNSDNEQWDVYRSGSSSNDFTKVQAGQAYWIKLNVKENIKPGLIVGEGSINGSTTYDTLVAKKWNMLAFNDASLIDNSSAVFVDATAYSGSGLAIRRSVYINDVIKVPSTICDNDVNVSAYINNAAAVIDSNGSAHWNIRAYPAIYPANGIVLVSDENIELNATTGTKSLFKSIAGEDLNTSIYQSLYTTTPNASYTMITTQQLNEYMLAVKINEEALLNLPNDGTRKGRLEAAYVQQNSFNIDISAKNTLTDIAVQIGLDMSNNLFADGYAGAALIDTNMDGNGDTILIASTDRFLLKDGTFSKVYEYASSGAAASTYISSSGTVTTFNTVANDIAATVSNINAIEASTGVKAYVVNNAANLLMITSDTNRDISILENATRSQFNILVYENNDTVKGAILDLYRIPDLASGPILSPSEGNNSNWTINASDITAGTFSVGVPQSIVCMTEDLKYMSQQTDDYTIDSPAYDLAEVPILPDGLMIENIYGSELQSGYIHWMNSDMTIDPQLYNNSDNFNVQKIDRTKGYWVYLAANSSNTISISNLSFSGSVEQNFDNNFSYTKYAVGSVSNFFDKSLSARIDVDNVSTSSQVYRAELVIDGKKNTLVREGTSTLFSGNINSFETDGLEVRDYPALNRAMQFRIYDGLNNRFTYDITTFNTTRPEVPTVGHLHYPATHVDYLTINVSSGSVIKIFDGNISDYAPLQSNNLIISSSGLQTYGTSNNYIYNPASNPDIFFGTPSRPFYDIRIVVANSDNLWSDMRRVFYAPVYKGSHILQDDDVIRTDYDSFPVAYVTTGDSYYDWEDGNGQIDSGVQLKVDDNDTVANTTKLSMSYKPKNVTIDTSVPYTAYLSDNNATNGQLGVITYASEYQGSVFYIYHQVDQKLYYGIFPGSGVNDTNSTMYVLTQIDSDQTFIKP